MKRTTLTLAIVLLILLQGRLFSQDVYFLEGIVSNGTQTNYTYNTDGSLNTYLTEREGVFSQEGIDLFENGQLEYDEETGQLKSIRAEHSASSQTVEEAYDIYTYSYNVNSLLDTILVERFNLSDVRMEYDRYAYAYNENNQMTMIDFKFVDQIYSFEFRQMQSIEYDSLFRISKIEFLGLPNGASDFVLERSRNFEYGSNGKISKGTTIDEQNNEVFAISNYEYDQDGNLDSYMTDPADPSIPTRIIELEYDKTIPNANLIIPEPRAIFSPTIIDIYNSQLLSFTTTDASGAVFPNLSSEYFWVQGEVNTKVSNTLIKQLDVYPNPVVDILNFDRLDSTMEMQLTVYDVLGRSIKNESLSNSTQSFDVSEISEGSYFFVLTNGEEKTYSGRFVKQ